MSPQTLKNDAGVRYPQVQKMVKGSSSYTQEQNNKLDY